MNILKQLTEFEKKSPSSRVAINSILIFSQRFYTAALSLITTPLILKVLGVEDYGLYILIVGVVGTLSFLNWALSSSTQRYISFSLGEKSKEKLRNIFNTSMGIHFIYGIVLVFILCIIGLLFINTILNVPEARTNAARIVLIIMSVTTLILIVSIPFDGLLKAHENFFLFSFLGIIESSIKLIIAIILQFVSMDKLISYMLLLLASSITIFFIKYFSCRRLYIEATLSMKSFDFKLSKEMLSFTGWSFIGSIAIVSRNQGVSVLLNMFFGVIKNAAYGIAMQISSALSILSQGVIGSLTPQILKSAGAGDNKKMLYLMRSMSKICIISVSIIAIPFFFEAPMLLKFWLKIVPENTVLYSRLIIIFGLIMLLSAGIKTVFDAIGKVRDYNIWVSIILIFNLPISYFLFKAGFASYSIILVGIVLEVLSYFVRLQLLKKYADLSIGVHLSEVIICHLVPTVLIVGLILLIRCLNLGEIPRLFITILISITIFPLLSYFLSLDKKQKVVIGDFLRQTFIKKS